MFRNCLAFSLFAALLITFQACSPAIAPEIYRAAPPSTSVFRDTLPFEFREGFIVVRARLNDKSMPLDFIWDSGAAVSTISQATREYLGLPNSIQAGAVTTLDAFHLSGITFPTVPVEIVNYDGYAAPKCIAEAGVIGANIIRHCNWHIDFDQQLLIFSDLATPTASTSATHTLTFKTTPYGQPEVKMTSAAMGKAKAVASIGHSGPVRISRKQLPDTGTMVYDRAVVDRFASGIDTAVVFENADLQVGGLNFQGTLKVQSGRQNQIGNALWAHYNLTLNFEEATIQLSPRATAPTPAYALPRLGWMPHFTPKSDLTVGFIVVGSPAWEAGLRMGDVIDQIDRRASPGWYNDYCAYLSSVQAQFGAPEQMQVFKNGSKQPISLSVKAQP
ncbi:PDZ domain-containing protein [Phaeodactylibacter sp.]|uniref:PDZ domain-containing protein n=1 Tax=Phaeodactylibacter sp. TaxID=1940289 RepID=UPI0025E7B062|nr:PDZ domain-containing protein [Phaeodactylibacter sp.]MCI4650290.1 PDZ domain-containing protein [Phaeodactylibacter sp.]MCI5093533.1 PDZ domain-containing protein [Phaeodactylibacter sp.]